MGRGSVCRVHPTSKGQPRLPDSSVLILLEDDLDAMKLVATWAIVGKHCTDTDEFQDDVELVDRWASISGVDQDDIPRRAAMLFGAEILGPAGHVDANALSYVRVRVAKSLPKARTPAT